MRLTPKWRSTPPMKLSSNRSLLETSPSTSTPVELLSPGGDVEKRAQENGQDPHATPEKIDNQNTNVGVKSETEAGTGSWWGQCVYRGGASYRDDGGEAAGVTGSCGGGINRNEALPEEVGRLPPG